MAYYGDGWLQEHVVLSEPLSRALDTGRTGGRAQRQIVLDMLAGQLRLDGDRLGYSAYVVLDAILQPLQDEMDRGPGSWLEIDGPHRRVVRAAVQDVEVDHLLSALAQFGWQRDQLPRDTLVENVDSHLRTILVRRLADRLFKAWERWRNGNVWNHDMIRRAAQHDQRESA